MSISLVLFLLLQQSIINNPAGDLYEQIYREARPTERIKLILEFEKKYLNNTRALTPPSMKAQIMSFGMDHFERQKNWPKMVEYGEKALQWETNDTHVLTVLARQYALSGDNIDRAAAYARRALDAVSKLRAQKPPSGFTKDAWDTYLKNTEVSAQGTLDYIRSMSLRLLQRPRKP